MTDYSLKGKKFENRRIYGKELPFPKECVVECKITQRRWAFYCDGAPVVDPIMFWAIAATYLAIRGAFAAEMASLHHVGMHR